MKRDSIFYTIFQQYPALLFGLLENAPDNAANYRFESVAVKEPKFEIDGVFIPPENEGTGVVYFCEVQFQKDERLYERLFGESFLYFYRNRERYRNWQAVIIYPSRSIEQTDIEPYRCLLESNQVHRIYLDELGSIEDLPIEIGLLLLTILQPQEAATAARNLVNRTQQERPQPQTKQSIIDIITRILSYQFTNLTRVEIEAMLGITIEQTRLYQDIKEEGEREGEIKGEIKGEIRGKLKGEREFALRILTKRFGEIPDELKSQIEKLSLEQLETLGDDLLDFVNLDDLAAWLEKIQVPEE